MINNLLYVFMIVMFEAYLKKQLERRADLWENLPYSTLCSHFHPRQTNKHNPDLLFDWGMKLFGKHQKNLQEEEEGKNSAKAEWSSNHKVPNII